MTSKEKSDNQILEEISAKLDKLIAVISIEGKPVEQQLKILKNLGFSSKEASGLTGISYSSIRHRKGWK